MILTWEGFSLLFGWMLVVLGGAIWVERRLARIETDQKWIINLLMRRERVAGKEQAES